MDPGLRRDDGPSVFVCMTVASRCHRPRVSTTASGRSPASARSRFVVASSAIARRVSCVAEPTCGSAVTRGCVRSGESSGSGSVAKTSSPAARSRPPSSAASSAGLLHDGAARAVDEDRARLHQARTRAHPSGRASPPTAAGSPRRCRHAPAVRRAAGASRGRERRHVDRRAARGTAPAWRSRAPRAAPAPGRCGRSRGCRASCRARPSRTGPRRCCASSGPRARAAPARRGAGCTP